MTSFRSLTHAPIPQQILHCIILSLTYSILHFYMHRSHVIHAHFNQLLKPKSSKTLIENAVCLAQNLQKPIRKILVFRGFRRFPGFLIFFGRFKVREVFQWIRTANLTHMVVLRSQDNLSGPISADFGIIVFACFCEGSTKKLPIGLSTHLYRGSDTDLALQPILERTKRTDLIPHA